MNGFLCQGGFGWKLESRVSHRRWSPEGHKSLAVLLPCGIYVKIHGKLKSALKNGLRTKHHVSTCSGPTFGLYFFGFPDDFSGLSKCRLETNNQQQGVKTCEEYDGILKLSRRSKLLSIKAHLGQKCKIGPYFDGTLKDTSSRESS